VKNQAFYKNKKHPIFESFQDLFILITT